MPIYGEEGKAFPLKIVQCCLGEALCQAESGPRLPRLVDGKLKVNVGENEW